MISGVGVHNFKGFRHLKLSALGSFHVLAGANGSGKSTLFEVFEFIKDLVQFDTAEALGRRNVESLRDLTFDRAGGMVKFDCTFQSSLFGGEPVAYHISLVESEMSGTSIAAEYLKKGAPDETRDIVFRSNGSFYYEPDGQVKGDHYLFLTERGALAQLPPDEQRYPTANRAKRLLASGVRMLRLDNPLMGAPCPPSLSATELFTDGRNLARVAGRLLRNGANDWINHLRLALEDLNSIDPRRQDDQTEYLLLRYRNGLEIPSWLASFGTLRTLALTLPAFLPADEPTLYLFEEPENGIHPKAIEIVVDAIKSIPNAQTFVTTHSPMIVQQVGVDRLLLFSKRDGEIVVEHGGDNKILRELDGVPDLATVFASRVLE